MTRITRLTRRTPLEAWSEAQERNARNVNGDKRRTHTYLQHNILVGGFLPSLFDLHVDRRPPLLHRRDAAVPVGAGLPYKHTTLEVYKAFFPISAALENCNLQVDAMVYHHRKLLHIEKVVAALLLVGDSVRVRIQRKLEWLQLAPASLSLVQVDTATRWLQGLQSLLFSYVPALFALGVQVRNCNWSGRQPGTGQAAHTVLEWSPLLHLFLTGDWDAKTQYVPNLSVTLAVWQD